MYGSLTIGGSDVAIGDKSVVVATHLYHTENITDPNAIQQSLMGDSLRHD